MLGALSWFRQQQDKEQGMPSSQQQLLTAYEQLLDKIGGIPGIDMIACNAILDDLKKWMLSGAALRVVDNLESLRAPLALCRGDSGVDIWPAFQRTLVALVVYASESSDQRFRSKVIELSKRLPQ